MRIMNVGTCTKLVTHVDKGSSTSNFYKHRFKDDHYSTLSKSYSLRHPNKYPTIAPSYEAITLLNLMQNYLFKLNKNNFSSHFYEIFVGTI